MFPYRAGELWPARRPGPLQIQDDVNRAPFLSPQMCFSGRAIFLPGCNWDAGRQHYRESPTSSSPSNATCKWWASYQMDSQQGTTGTKDILPGMTTCTPLSFLFFIL
ncbi:hypothetical protein CDAR_40151 [Caerostris darwini]|uniref:Uncharacterized protein n=1 Tax=Caerostris darwini TaxID=1538125 RepID=A0AAV4RC40_9ARAC|nr:hypothetical protein CDAR_40151 [Caerostris darwini]